MNREKPGGGGGEYMMGDAVRRREGGVKKYDNDNGINIRGGRDLFRYGDFIANGVGGY